MTTSENLDRFIAALASFLVPVALDHGLSVTWHPRNPGEILCALQDESVCILVYLASGHGINLTATVAPLFDGSWNPPSERGLPWLIDFLELPPWQHRRFDSYDERDQHIFRLASVLPAVVDSVRARGAPLWPQLHAFIAQRPRP
jgi:hypothetical protein